MSTTVIASIILVASFIILMALRLEIAYAMGISTIITLIYMKIPLTVVFQGMITGANSFTFLAVPFFVLMGELLSDGKVTDVIMELADALVGWMRGGLAMVNVVASFIFGGVSGSAVADIASLGPIERDMMMKGGYEEDFSVCMTLATSIQGILVPPSQNMVIYAVAAGSVSIGALLIAGFVPGAVLCVVMCIMGYVYAKKNNIPITGKFSFKRLMKTFFKAFFPMMTIVIVIGGVTFGIMTATESSAFAVAYALILTLFIMRSIKFKDIYTIMSKTVNSLASMMILIAIAYSFGWIVAFLGIPKTISTALLSITTNKYILLILTNVLLLFLGCFMSMGSIIMILTPILLPILMQVGVDPVHFGVIMVFNCGIGLLTPPVGAGLYVGCGYSGLKMEQLAKRMIPFYIVMFFTLLLITYIPAFSLWLPGVMMQ